MSNDLKFLNLMQDRPVIGFGLNLGCVRTAEIAGQTKFDFAMVDMQHGHYEKYEATDALRVLALGHGPVPFARVANNRDSDVNAMLDAGASGIMIPMVQNREQAEDAVRSCYYAPIGFRSKSSPAAAFYGNDYYEKINDHVSVIIMIETPEAAMRAKEIFSVPYISGCLIGAGDLGYILKKRGESDEKFNYLINTLIETAHSKNIAIGIAAKSSEDVEYWWSNGMNFFLASHDIGLMQKAFASHERDFMDRKYSAREIK